MPGGLGSTVAGSALEAWMDCKAHGYVIEERRLQCLLPLVAAHLPGGDATGPPPSGTLGELFCPPRPLFLELTRPRGGQVEFLYFWKAFGEAARLAGAVDDGLAAELETLRDTVLRRLEEGTGTLGGGGSSSSSTSRPLAHRAIPTMSLIDELHRAASMSVYPHFWKVAMDSLNGAMGMPSLSLEELTSVLLSWLHDAPLWEQQALALPNPVTRQESDASSVQDLVAVEAMRLPVRLHIYDVSQEESIQRLNRILAHKSSPIKLGGVFHAGVEVNGLEWSFGYSPSETRPGVSCVAPRTHPQHHYRQTVHLRRTKLGPEEVAAIISEMIEEYPGDDYDLLRRNCCHFADDFVRRLGVGGIPSWVHRLARLGATVDTLLQAAPRPIKERIYGTEGY